MTEVRRGRFRNDGFCTTSSAEILRVSPLQISNTDTKESEADYGDFVLDRTESLDLYDDDVVVLESQSSVEESLQWKEKILTGMLTSHEEESGSPLSGNIPPKKQNSCFNCDGDHHLVECAEPKDMKRIRKRQAEMRNKNNTVRYHCGDGPSMKKFRAGHISDELRDALGIGRHDIPEYIYRMRKMGFIRGYPPGYLKKAIERDDSNKVLQFHALDGKGSCVDELGRTESPPPKINADKMIYYCGFNQGYRGLIDRENFRVPPFLEFVAFHQDILNEKHARKLINHRRMLRREIKHVRKGRLDISREEVLILEPPPPPPLSLVLSNGNDEEVTATDCEAMKTPSSSHSPKALKGSSVGIMMGTPVLNRRRFDDEPDVDEQKPSLDNFSKGIVPFEAREEQTPHKGFLKRIMYKIKRITR